MKNQFKQVTIATMLCSVIILLNMDLSCLKPYFIKVAKAIETRQTETQYEIQRYTVVIPNAYLLSVKKDVYVEMSSYVHSTTGNYTTVNNLHTPQGVDCRGSPLIRSP